MVVRSLNEEGIDRMVEFLDSLTTDSPQHYPKEVLTDPATSERVEPDTEVEDRSFSTRFELAEYLNDRLDALDEEDLQRNRGLWSWLALFYFDQLCPTDGNGRRNPRQVERWVLSPSDWRTYYRHLLAGPFRIFRFHSDDPSRCWAVLANPPDTPGEVAEQLASRQELITSEPVMVVATDLYVVDKGELKKGAAGKGPGSARRLADVLNQFDVTWDLHSMSPGELLEMLPDEFDRFRAA